MVFSIHFLFVCELRMSRTVPTQALISGCPFILFKVIDCYFLQIYIYIIVFTYTTYFIRFKKTNLREISWETTIIRSLKFFMEMSVPLRSSESVSQSNADSSATQSPYSPDKPSQLYKLSFVKTQQLQLDTWGFFILKIFVV